MYHSTQSIIWKSAFVDKLWKRRQREIIEKTKEKEKGERKSDQSGRPSDLTISGRRTHYR